MLGRWLLVGAATLSVPTVAAAQTAPPPAGVTVSEQQPQELEEDDNGVRRKVHEPLFVGLDFMVGFGNYTAVESQIQPGTTGQGSNLGYVFMPDIQIRTETYMLLGHYRFKHFGIGVRLPIIVGHIEDGPPSSNTRGEDVFNNGNLEVSADMPHRLSEQVRMVPEVALTLPISSGSTPPYYQSDLATNTCAADNTGQCTVDPVHAQSLADQYDRYAVGLAAALARGGEEDALFYPWRLGVTPKVTFDIKFGHTRLIPYVKIPIMFNMENNVGDTDEPVRIEVVGGVKLQQEIGPLKLGVRVVGMIPIAARTTLKTPMLSVWPEVRVQLTPGAQLWLSGMIPLAGDYSIFDAGNNGAFEAGIGATF